MSLIKTAMPPSCDLCVAGFRRVGGVHIGSIGSGPTYDESCDRVFATLVGDALDTGRRLKRPWVAYVDGEPLRNQNGDPRCFGSETAAYAAARRAAPQRGWGEQTASSRGADFGWLIVDTQGEDTGWANCATCGALFGDGQGWGAHLLWRPLAGGIWRPAAGGILDAATAAELAVARDAEQEGRTEDAAAIRGKMPATWAVMSWTYGHCTQSRAYEAKWRDRELGAFAAACWNYLIEEYRDAEIAKIRFELENYDKRSGALDHHDLHPARRAISAACDVIRTVGAGRKG